MRERVMRMSLDMRKGDREESREIYVIDRDTGRLLILKVEKASEEIVEISLPRAGLDVYLGEIVVRALGKDIVESLHKSTRNVSKSERLSLKLYPEDIKKNVCGDGEDPFNSVHSIDYSMQTRNGYFSKGNRGR